MRETTRNCFHKYLNESGFVTAWPRSSTKLCDVTGADPEDVRWGARPPLGRSFTIQKVLFNRIRAPVHHWAPTPGRNPISARVSGHTDTMDGLDVCTEALLSADAVVFL